MINIDPNSTKSIYEQIYDEFVKLISNKVLKPDEQLPSVRELASVIRINPNTIQRAYKLLESNHFIYSLPGKGNFVATCEDLMLAEIKHEEDHLVRVAKRLQSLGESEDRIIQMIQKALKGEESDAKSHITQ
jgi:GntR family transcriptional regulator